MSKIPIEKQRVMLQEFGEIVFSDRVREADRCESDATSTRRVMLLSLMTGSGLALLASLNVHISENASASVQQLALWTALWMALSLMFSFITLMSYVAYLTKKSKGLRAEKLSHELSKFSHGQAVDLALNLETRDAGVEEFQELHRLIERVENSKSHQDNAVLINSKTAQVFELVISIVFVLALVFFILGVATPVSSMILYDYS